MEVNRESIDKILEKVTNTTKKAIKKSGDAYEIAKIRLSINSDKSKINELKQQIGELVYNAYSGKSSNGDDVEEACRAIDEINDEIKNKEEALAKIKNLIRCPKCGINNEKDASFCKNCSQELKKDEVYDADVVVDSDDLK